ncbi:MAG: ion transporter [Firmicutes bacterium]|nr:ion transporter [Bacillota bacterium]
MTYVEFKRKVFDVINPEGKSLRAKIFDNFIMILIIINVSFIIADTFEAIDHLKHITDIVETVSVIIFVIEYGLRIWTAPLLYPNKTRFRATVAYLFSFMAIIDFLSIFPALFGNSTLLVLRALRLLRLLRLFKLTRKSDAMGSIGKVFKDSAGPILSAVVFMLMFMLIGSILMYNVEKEANPDNYKNAFDALWWAVSTVTTVGYGDISPVTTMGKILGACIALLGVGLVAIPTGILSAGFMKQVDNDARQKLREEARLKGVRESEKEFLGEPVFVNASVVAERADSENKKVLIGSYVIIPKSKVQNPFEMSEVEWADTRAALIRVKQHIDERHKPDGYTLGWNVGECSGQTSPHTVFHVIPRFKDEKEAGRGFRSWLKSEDNIRASLKEEK